MPDQPSSNRTDQLFKACVVGGIVYSRKTKLAIGLLAGAKAAQLCLRHNDEVIEGGRTVKDCFCVKTKESKKHKLTEISLTHVPGKFWTYAKWIKDPDALKVSDSKLENKLLMVAMFYQKKFRTLLYSSKNELTYDEINAKLTVADKAKCRVLLKRFKKAAEQE